MDDRELCDTLRSIIDKKRRPFETQLTPLENEVYKQMLPTLLNNAQKMFIEECKKYEERNNG